MDNYYYKIAISEYESALEIDKEIESFLESEDEDYLIEMRVSSSKSYQARKFTVVIVFSAMVMESFIFQYGKEHLGATYYTDHLDKLDLASKWVVVPQMVLGNL